MLRATTLFLAVLGGVSAAPKCVPRDTAGCGKALPSGQSVGGVFTVDLGDRSFLVSIPKTYKSQTKTSAILSFHGALRTANDQLKLDGLTDSKLNPDAFVIYPESDGDYWQGSPDVDVDDVKFTTDILQYLESSYCIDQSRIFATGKSQGGGFVGILACDADLSKRIAAFAPVSAAFYINGGDSCDPNTVKIPCNPGRTNIPLIEMHGGNDTTIKYAGGSRKGSCLPSIPHYVRAWAERDGLGTKNVSSTIAANTVLYKYGTGANEGLIQHIYESDIGHDWPSTKPNSDNSRDGHHVASFNASPIIMDFFSKHPLA